MTYPAGRVAPIYGGAPDEKSFKLAKSSRSAYPCVGQNMFCGLGRTPGEMLGGEQPDTSSHISHHHVFRICGSHHIQRPSLSRRLQWGTTMAKRERDDGRATAHQDKRSAMQEPSVGRPITYRGRVLHFGELEEAGLFSWQLRLARSPRLAWAHGLLRRVTDAGHSGDYLVKSLFEPLPEEINEGLKTAFGSVGVLSQQHRAIDEHRAHRLDSPGDG